MEWKWTAYCVCFLLFLLLFPFSASVLALEEEDVIMEQLEKMNLDQLQREVEAINERIEGIVPHLNLKELLLAFIRGEMEVNWLQIIKALLIYLGQEVSSNLYLLGQILILAVLSAILKVFHNSFNSKTISDTANLIIFLLLAVLLLNSFKVALEVGEETIDSMVSFIHALLPVLLTLLLSMGAITSAAVFHPLTFLIMSTLAAGIKSIILPLVFISAILSIVNCISGDFKISRLAALFKEVSLALLGLSLLLFIGGLVIHGGAAAMADSLTLRTARYLSGALIPVIGGIFADAIELIASCSLLIKNALNILGLLGIGLIVVFPLLKLLALVFIYRLAGALIQPICEERLAEMFSEVGNSLMVVFLLVITTAFMFFIVITVVVAAANLTVMMR